MLARHTKEAGKVEAQDAIALVTRSLCKRLPKMPFPQATKAEYFDYDGLAKSNVSLHLLPGGWIGEIPRNAKFK